MPSDPLLPRRTSGPDWRILRFENDKGEYAEVGTFLGPNSIPMPPGYRLVSSKRMVPADAQLYDRDVLLEVLVHHQQTANSGCHCGWAELGRSYCEHVREVYEQSMAAR